MRRYELMLVIRPDTADDRVQQILDRTTRGIAAAEGQIIKVSPWGRRRLAYPIGGQREGSYFIVVFEAPSEAIEEFERSLNITEEVMRHLVTRIERPASTRRSGRKGEEDGQPEGDDGADAYDDAFDDAFEDQQDDAVEVIDESESEAAPRATD
jgi:small subunit ribosomal protein S6